MRLKTLAALAGFGAGAAGLIAFGLLGTDIVRAPIVRPILDVSGVWPDKYDGKTATQAIKEVKTWDQARDYMMSHLRYDYWARLSNDLESTQPDLDDGKTFWYSNEKFSNMHRGGTAVCVDAGFAASRLLNDDPRYETKALLLSPRKWGAGHSVCLVKDKMTGLYGSLGINEADCIRPIKKGEREVAEEINQACNGELPVFSFRNYEEAKFQTVDVQTRRIENGKLVLGTRKAKVRVLQ